MLVPFKVLLPKRIFKTSRNEDELMFNVLVYMQRYPHYVFSHLEGNFAVCEKIKSLKEE